MADIMESIPFILSTIQKRNYKHVVLQLAKNHLSSAFQLTHKLRQQSPKDIQFYTLYDSLKKQCCTDILGAKHIEYDGLFHFGEACFSEQYQPNHHYILPSIPQQKWKVISSNLEDLETKIKEHQITMVIGCQDVYERLMEKQKQLLGDSDAQLLRLPFDQREDSGYFGFSYYCSEKILQKEGNRNIVVIGQKNEVLLQNLCLCRSRLRIGKIFTITEQFQEFSEFENKKLMQRISQSSQLASKQIFGIVVCNPATQFCQYQIKRCRQILEGKKLKNFTFMMNNLNECKLGNFPQIQAYIVISCYNHSLYTTKDFHHLVVTPYDLEMAFHNANLQNYISDLKNQKHPTQEKINEHNEEELEKQENYEGTLMKTSKEVMLRDAIQTLDFYRERQYKGLDFSEKKQIEKIKKGKIGLAEKYTPLE